MIRRASCSASATRSNRSASRFTGNMGARRLPRPFSFMTPSRFRAAPGPLDQLLSAADEALKTLAGAVTAARPSPCSDSTVPSGEADRRLAAGLMRVNHTGEICAQALYSGQALVARDPQVRFTLQSAAGEERDHLAWCRGRLQELDSRPSLLDPLWYAGSFAWGVISGAAGDRWSLGFLAETEAQVERHLEGHLDRLPAEDRCSRAIVTQMHADEHRHGEAGRALGASELPHAVKMAMRAASKVMTRTAYWV
jgi:3-demethoxyubiquinol 3-hydroxylase